MKFSVSTYSFGSYCNDDRLGMFGVIDKTAEMGFDGIEFCGVPNNDADLARRLGERAREKGLEIVNLTVGADFIADYDGAIASLRQNIDLAAALGSPLMRHDVTGGFRGIRKYSIGYDDALPTLVRGIREVTAYAEQKGVRTMTENHGIFSQDACRVEKLINAVACENFGALVDIGNFMCADEDPTLSVGIMAPYAFHVHAKDFHWKSGNEICPGDGWFRTRSCNYLRGAIIGHGDAKVAQSVSILKKYGYDGYLSIEFEGMEDKIVGIERGLCNLRRFVEMA